MVSGNFFTMLGVSPALGRVFNSQEDDQVYQGHPVVVLSHDYWVTRFNRDPAVIGKKILVNNYPDDDRRRVGGGVRRHRSGARAADPRADPDEAGDRARVGLGAAWTNERTRWVQVFARLKPGYTVESAQAPMQGLFTQIRQHEMTLPGAKDWSQFQRDQFMTGQLRVEKAAMGYSSLRNDFSTALVVLMAWSASCC